MGRSQPHGDLGQGVQASGLARCRALVLEGLCGQSTEKGGGRKQCWEDFRGEDMWALF